MTKNRRSNGVAAVVTKISQTPKVCRLCETKDGPFLNIFDTDMDLSKKIDTLLPITVMEYDDLPHKVCFRCSAKLTDLDEFVNKCIETQENLYKSLNKATPKLKNENIAKSKKLWSSRLSQNKISNNDYCEELIKKALESVGKNVCDSIKGGGGDIKDSGFVSKASNKVELKDSKLRIENEDENIEQSSGRENKKQNNFIKIPEDKNINSSVKISENKRRNSIVDITDNTEILDLKSRTTRRTTNETKNQTDLQVKKSIKSTANESNENTKRKNMEYESNENGKTKKIETESIGNMKNRFEIESSESKRSTIKEKENLTNNENKGEDPNFEKDIRVCISRVSSKDKEGKYEVKQDTSISKKNVSTFKVAGVGTVYSCEDCSRIFLNKDKMPGHKCIADKSKLIKESDMYDAKQSNNDVKDSGKGKDLKNEEQKPIYEKEKALSGSGKKVPGPASKTLNKVIEKKEVPHSSPSIESLTLDSIMKNLLSNQMHYQIVPGPNNTITLQATPQTINIPIGVLQQQPMSLTPQPTSVASPIIESHTTVPIPQTGTRNNVDSSAQADINNKPVNQSNAKAAGLTARGRSKVQVSQPNVISNDKQSKTRTSLENATQSNTKANELLDLQRVQITRVKNLENQFCSVPQKPTSGGPFPVALAKNLFISDNSSEERPAVVDSSKPSRDNKRKSRDIIDRSKKAKINPEIIELDDDPEPVLEMDLLQERPKTKRGRGRPRVGGCPNSSDNTAVSQTYRVVPNNNPRKLIISAVGSASQRESERLRNSEAKRPSAGRPQRSATTKGQNENCSFFTDLTDDEDIESIIPDKTVVQESQITTTVSARASKSRSSVGAQKCMMCNMSFSDNAKLSAHMKIHYANWI